LDGDCVAKKRPNNAVTLLSTYQINQSIAKFRKTGAPILVMLKMEQRSRLLCWARRLMVLIRWRSNTLRLP